MSAGYLQLELWSETVTGSGTRLAMIPASDARLLEEIRPNLVTNELRFSVARSWADLAMLIVRRVVRVVYVDGDYTEFRISEINASTLGDGTVTVRALGIIYDLGERSNFVSQTVSSVVQYEFNITGDIDALVATYVVGFGPTWLTTGSSGLAGTISVAVSYDTPLSLALKLTQAIGIKTGGYYEFRLDRSGTSNYAWAIGQYNNAVTAVDVRLGKNLQNTNRLIATAEQTTRLLPRGSDGGHCGDAQWKVSAVSLNTYIEITDINGSGYQPIVADDQFNTTYYWIHEDGVAHQITDTVLANKRFTMASTTGIATNEWGRIATNSSGDQLAVINSPGGQATYGVRIGTKTWDLPSHTNWAKNPDIGDWTGTDPADFTRAGTAATKTTTTGLWLTGGQSARVTVNSSALQTTSRSINLVAGQTLTYTMWLRIATLSAASQSTVRFKDPQSGTDIDYYLDGTVSDLAETNTWLAFSRSFAITSTGVKALQAGILTQLGSVDVYWDSVQFSVSTAALPFVKGSGGAELYIRGLEYFANNNDDPTTTYDVVVADLYRLNPTTWANDKLNIGAYLQITDDVLNIAGGSAQLRVVKLDTNLLHPGDSKATLATNASQFTRLLAAA